jgi:hypothetical protein
MDGYGYCYDYVVGWEDGMDGKWVWAKDYVVCGIECYF